MSSGFGGIRTYRIGNRHDVVEGDDESMMKTNIMTTMMTLTMATEARLADDVRDGHGGGDDEEDVDDCV